MLKRRLEGFKTPLTALGGALLGVVIVLLYLELSPPEGRYTDADIRRLAQERVDAITPTPPIEPEVFALVRPSVVLITRDGGGGTSDPARVGSGVLVDLNGTILTANHVVEGSQTVSVRFYDGTTVTGRIGQTQPDRDLATVLVNRVPNGLQPATLAGGAREGDKVIAVGSPFGGIL